MKKANADLKTLLSAADVYAYELYKELGICCTTYTTKMRKELSVTDRADFIRAIERIMKRRASVEV